MLNSRVVPEVDLESFRKEIITIHFAFIECITKMLSANDYLLYVKNIKKIKLQYLSGISRVQNSRECDSVYGVTSSLIIDEILNVLKKLTTSASYNIELMKEYNEVLKAIRLFEKSNAFQTMKNEFIEDITSRLQNILQIYYINIQEIISSHKSSRTTNQLTLFSGSISVKQTPCYEYNILLCGLQVCGPSASLHNFIMSNMQKHLSQCNWEHTTTINERIIKIKYLVNRDRLIENEPIIKNGVAAAVFYIDGQSTGILRVLAKNSPDTLIVDARVGSDRENELIYKNEAGDYALPKTLAQVQSNNLEEAINSLLITTTRLCLEHDKLYKLDQQIESKVSGILSKSQKSCTIL